MTRERCSTCGSMLLWANHRLVCPRPHCPGHQSGNTFAALAPCAVEDGTPIRLAADTMRAGRRRARPVFLGMAEMNTPALLGEFKSELRPCPTERGRK